MKDITYTTPSDPTRCRYFNPNGPTPCHHPHCDCPMPTPAFLPPKGCHCLTLVQRDGCYEACEPAHGKERDVMELLKSAAPQASLLWLFGAMVFALLLYIGCARGAEVQPASATPVSCEAIMAMDKSCTSVRLFVKMYGKVEAERRARTCGASDRDIEQAKECLAQHGD